TPRPSSTYVAQDEGAGSRTRRTFTTAATGSPAQVAAAGGGGSTSSSSTGKKGTSQGGATSPIGTPIATLRGTLVGTVGPTGALTLTRNGKPVQILPAGRYDFSVVDRSHSSGFTVQAVKGNPIALTGGTFVGKRAKAITLG